MIEPPRLRELADDEVGDMIRAARADGPRDGAADRRRLLSTLAALDAPSVAHARVRPVAARRSRWALGALAGIAFVAGGFGLLSTYSTDAVVATRASEPAPPAVTPAPSPEPEATETAVPSVDVAELPATAAPPRNVAPRRVPRGATSSVPAAVAPANRLDELAAVERARRQLTQGDPAGARRYIAEYRVTFTQGRFTEEIDALEVEALAASGERASAKAKATEFLTRYPSSPYARRLRSVLLTLDTTETP